MIQPPDPAKITAQLVELRLEHRDLDVAIAAVKLHQGGFVGNMIPWSLWKEAVAALWRRKEASS